MSCAVRDTDGCGGWFTAGLDAAQLDDSAALDRAAPFVTGPTAGMIPGLMWLQIGLDGGAARSTKREDLMRTTGTITGKRVDGEPRIIREQDGSLSPAMLALMIEWGVDANWCGAADCENTPNTLIRQDGLMFVLCEQHFQQASQKGGTTLQLQRYTKENGKCSRA